MTRPSPDAYLTPYRIAAESFGSNFDVTLWASTKSQQRRFDIFTQMCFFTGKRVLDAGCSRGDFAAWMHKRDIAYGQYIGIDGLHEVINYARHRNLPNAEFHAGDFVANPKLLVTGRPQIITISGSLNTMDFDTARKVLDAAWQATSETLIFNFLSDRVSKQAPPQKLPAHRLDTARLLAWAMDMTPMVQFRQDYFPGGHDATIMMGREG